MYNSILTTFLFLFTTVITFAQEQEIVVEDFDYEPQGWLIEDNNNAQSYFKDGVYYLNNKSSNQSKGYYNKLEINSTVDYSIEIKLLQKSGKTNLGYGLVWNRQSDKDYLYFKVTQDGMFRIEGKKDGEELVIKDWKKLKKKDVKRIGQSQILNITQLGNTVTYYVNDTKVYSGKPIQFTGSEVGILLEGKMEAKVDYIKVIRQSKD